ncbi:TPA: hypothetical protein DIC20_01360 [Candidatus Dependentiae bacterium]|nr:MAG: hypothetical protein US03_C0002G0120 [candidate division TM6 bacterium GW2011_GWF2_36_131]KKQ03553.1 MAG: hypothetical protein US13_C0002G0119 [candidate division TM6 bacterium GW2011_GWE2_36_25]KKQ20172.1 MAG: hypothetical protein US32_C0001G0069 [candidate division TM6 bacterium GW2011_GWA2_36_9]HBR70713.1 hypothetical protein [Candidatus Dependentiae bacterium]HCU00333.1 hypothetical protein [Candidatus Dependentiae bacterium]
MKKYWIIFLFVVINFSQQSIILRREVYKKPPLNRKPSYPFITGDGFRALAQHILDQEKCFNPKNVQKKDIIFLKTDYLKYFFEKMFPKIKNNFILITHNSDYSAPQNYSAYLDDSRIIKWFAQNVEIYSHPKLIPIPIGLENRYKSRGAQIKRIEAFISQYTKNTARNIFVYANIANTHPNRSTLKALLSSQRHICWSERKPFFHYLKDLSRSIFVLSPSGHGLDCHRTWEALLLGAIPIVKTSSLDPMFQDLPVVIVKNWEELTKEFLEQKLQEFKKLPFNMEKIYFGYWKNLIQETN